MAEAPAKTSQGFEIEVIFANTEDPQLRRIRVGQGCTAAQAIAIAGLSHHWQPTIDYQLSLSCFGRLIAPETVLSMGDRVEILRPLLADPKERRRQKVKAAAASARRRRAQGVLDG